VEAALVVVDARCAPRPYATAAAPAPTSTTTAMRATARRLEELNMSFPFFEFVMRPSAKPR
jgi:hypothetical protein